MSRAPVAVLAAWLLSQAGASAQSAPPPATRAEALEAQRAARELTPGVDRQTWLERALFFVEEKRVFQRLNPPEGFYPRFGSIVNGSGFGVGGGYRRRPARGRVLLDASGAWTLRDFRTAQGRVALRPAGRPVELSAGSVWYDYPQGVFIGLGPASARVDRVTYSLEGLDTYAQVQAQKARRFVASGRVGLHRMTAGPGTDARFPSLEDRFTDVTAPGLRDPLTLTYAQASAGVDTRDQPRNTRGGGLYHASLGVFRGRNGDNVNFNRVDVTALQVIPIFDKKRGVALRATATRIDPVGQSRVPFFLMTTVGGGNSVRGFEEFRFRDAAAVTVNAEYRWEAFSGLDLALFVDAGNVGPTWRSIMGADLKTSWGGGFRFNTNRRVMLRIDLASGSEGTRIWARLGPVF